MKKIAVTLIAIVSILGNTVFAQDYVVTPNNYNLTFTATVEKEKEVFLMIVKKDADITNNDNIYAMAQGNSGKTGVITLEVEMPAEKNGVSTYGLYDAYMTVSGKAPVRKDLAFSDNSKRGDAVTEVKRQLDAGGTSESLFSNTSEHFVALASLGCSVLEFDVSASTIKGNTILVFNQNVTSAMVTEQTIGQLFNKAYAMVYINNNLPASDVLSGLGYGYETIEDSNLINWIDEYYQVNKNHSQFSGFDNSYSIAKILYQINNARFDQIENFISQNAHTLGINTNADYIKYNSLSSKVDANDKIVQYFKTNKCLSVNVLLSAIKNALIENPNNNNNNGPIISEGSSGGSVDFVKAPDLPAQIIPEEKGLKDIDRVQWAKPAIKTLYERKIISGDENGYFNPENNMKREEFIKMLVVSRGLYDENAECDFSDVPKSAWYYRYVASAVSAGLINGISENQFGSGLDITRQDMMLIIYRANKGNLEYVKDEPQFDDMEEISGYAKEAVIEMYKSGLVSGMGNNRIEPKGKSTKAQCAQLIYNMLYN